MMPTCGGARRSGAGTWPAAASAVPLYSSSLFLSLSLSTSPVSVHAHQPGERPAHRAAASTTNERTHERTSGGAMPQQEHLARSGRPRAETWHGAEPCGAGARQASRVCTALRLCARQHPGPTRKVPVSVHLSAPLRHHRRDFGLSGAREGRQLPSRDHPGRQHAPRCAGAAERCTAAAAPSMK
eukprot:scaffold1348_cov323-Prasinococcus_capsulatus_cf.AAC.11